MDDTWNVVKTILITLYISSFCVAIISAAIYNEAGPFFAREKHVSRFNYQRKSLHREVSVTFGRYTENEGVLYHANFSSRG